MPLGLAYAYLMGILDILYFPGFMAGYYVTVCTQLMGYNYSLHKCVVSLTFFISSFNMIYVPGSTYYTVNHIIIQSCIYNDCNISSIQASKP